MKVAQIAPLFESVPPKLYGGTERVVSYLTEALIRQGAQVTLFASGDSLTAAELRPMCVTALRLQPDCIDGLAHHVLMLERAIATCEEFDIIHFHTDYLHFPLARRIRTPHLTTLHGRLDIPDLKPVHYEFREMPLISISAAQREPLPWANWQGTVYHGLPPDLYPFCPEPGKYLAFLGRISPEKRADRAIEIANRSGIPLKIAAKVDKVDRDYFEAKIRSLLESPIVEYIGEIGESEKPAFLSGALALLFPIDWPEPFGLVTIESLACGTPVIAWPHGSVPEILTPGVTGFLVNSVDEAVEAVHRVKALDRAQCRRIFEQRFTSDRMASDYMALYTQRTASYQHAAESHLPTEVANERSTSDQGPTLHPRQFFAR
jgi:glycosyltransferase involved in cell wall biosynthesis